MWWASKVLGTMNENEELLADFCAFNSMIISSSIFPHKAIWQSPDLDCLVGQVVKVSASSVEDPVFKSRLHRDFSRSSHTRSSHTSDLKIGTPVATLPGARCYRVSAGTGRPGVSIL